MTVLKWSALRDYRAFPSPKTNIQCWKTSRTLKCSQSYEVKRLQSLVRSWQRVLLQCCGLIVAKIFWKPLFSLANHTSTSLTNVALAFCPHSLHQNIDADFCSASYSSRWMHTVLEMNHSLVIACLLKVPDECTLLRHNYWFLKHNVTPFHSKRQNWGF